MLICPKCDSEIDVEEEDVDEGDTLQCDECGTALKVASTGPIELEAADDKEDDDDDDDDLDDDDDDDDADDADEEEATDDWR